MKKFRVDSGTPLEVFKGCAAKIGLRLPKQPNVPKSSTKNPRLKYAFMFFVGRN